MVQTLKMMIKASIQAISLAVETLRKRQRKAIALEW